FSQWRFLLVAADDTQQKNHFFLIIAIIENEVKWNAVIAKATANEVQRNKAIRCFIHKITSCRAMTFKLIFAS
ncbi:MAG: hypothetical protein ACJARP_001974, partial [Vicingaceae bacterium]